MNKLFYNDKEVSRDNNLLIYEFDYLDENGDTHLKLKDLEQVKEDLIVSKIRRKYNLSQELAIQRKRDSEPQEFAEYYAYVEQCIQEVKNNLTSNQ